MRPEVEVSIYFDKGDITEGIRQKRDITSAYRQFSVPMENTWQRFFLLYFKTEFSHLLILCFGIMQAMALNVEVPA